MKAVVCEAFGGPEVLALRELPDPPPGSGELQARIKARGVQYVDVLMLAGKYQFRPERVTETAHWLEWQDWANPILQQPYEVEAGELHIPARRESGWIGTRRQSPHLADNF
jgi:hypothetical protein